jgi:glycerol-3-phosphate dehydrogenase
MDNGVELKLNHEVTDIEKIQGGYKVTTSKGEFESKVLINCAGVYADKIHNMVAEKSFAIEPRRGQYFVLDKSVGRHINHVIFPCPSSKGKGVLVTPTTHGNLLVGPTSEVIHDKMGIQTTMDGLEYVKEHADSIVKNIPYHKVIRSFAGLRPSSDVHDFIIEEAKDAEGFIDVAGIESPGLASSPAIAKEVVRLTGKRLSLIEKESFNPIRKGYTVFEKLSVEEKQKQIQKDPLYGQIICRCETVTEGEIVDCIRRNAGARTIKGVKKRVRPGMGRCQGGFCEPLVLEILARELGVDPMEVDYDSIGSNILIEETKQGGGF